VVGEDFRVVKMRKRFDLVWLQHRATKIDVPESQIVGERLVTHNRRSGFLTD
jgi:hypothetical protein